MTSVGGGRGGRRKEGGDLFHPSWHGGPHSGGMRLFLFYHGLSVLFFLPPSFLSLSPNTLPHFNNKRVEWDHLTLLRRPSAEAARRREGGTRKGGEGVIVGRREREATSWFLKPPMKKIKKPSFLEKTLLFWGAYYYHRQYTKEIEVNKSHFYVHLAGGGNEAKNSLLALVFCLRTFLP